MPELSQVVVNGVVLTLDLSQGLTVSNVAGQTVVNGQPLPAMATAQALTASGTQALASSGNISITNADTGTASSNGGGVEITGVVINSLDNAGGPVLLNLGATGTADASNSLVLGDAAAAMSFAAVETVHVVPAFDSHAAFFTLPSFGPDWLFH